MKFNIGFRFQTAIFSLWIIVLASSLFAQTSKLKIIGTPEKSQNEITGVRDVNGRICAAIQILSDMDGFSYDSYNGVIRVDNNPGKDMVYLQPDERVLEIYHTGFEMKKLILIEYGISLKSRDVWKIRISGDKKLAAIPIVVITNPAGAEILIDGEGLGTSKQQTTESGSHELRLRLEGYQPIIETISVDETHTLFEYKLEKIEDVDIQISSEPSGAVIYIDNVRFGKTPISDFYPAGKYPIRLEKEWYVTYEDYIEITPPQTKETITLNPDFGSIEVISEPESGMDIYLNEVSQDYKSPFKYERMKPGTYKIYARSEFYETNEIEIILGRGERQQTTLISQRVVGDIEVSSSPKSGLDIYFDGINQNVNTPHTFVNMQPGTYKISARSEYYETNEIEIILGRGEKQQITLNSQRVVGDIEVSSSPKSELDIYFDGINQNVNTPHTFVNMQPGTYEITARSEFYETSEIEIQLKPGESRQVKLTTEGNFAILNINTHENAKVTIDKQVITVLNNIHLQPSRITVEVTMPKAEPITKRLTLKKGDSVSVDLYPNVVTGTIQVVINPFDAKIELKGDASEFYTAIGKKVFSDIPVGTYELIAKADGHKTYKESFSLKANEKLKKDIVLLEGSDTISKISFVCSYDTPGIAEGVYVSGSYAYVADGESGLQVIDISRPSNPIFAGSCDTPGIAEGVYVSGSYAYVADGESGLQVIDVSNSSKPKLVSRYNMPGNARCVYVFGSYAYVADEESGLQVIDISNSSKPKRVGRYETPGSARCVYVSSDFAYVADGFSGLQIIDVSVPANPTLAGIFDTLVYTRNVFVSGNYAYVADERSGLLVINVSTLSRPILVSSYNPLLYTRDVFVSGNYAYVADGFSGLQIIDISTPANPVLAAHYNTPAFAYGIYVSGGYAYVADGKSGLQILKIE